MHIKYIISAYIGVENVIANNKNRRFRVLLCEVSFGNKVVVVENKFQASEMADVMYLFNLWMSLTLFQKHDNQTLIYDSGRNMVSFIVVNRVLAV